ncbi:MAG: anhydro-N-acetylmuramic acid kinase [Bacteroidales bacterium]
MSNNKYTVLGVMSGTSVDGLDLALTEFQYHNSNLKFEIIKAQTIEYNKLWHDRLKKSHLLSAPDLTQLHVDFGKHIGNSINDFLRQTAVKPQLICSHGHTVFHNPSKSYTLQIGDGASIAAVTQIPVVCDVRTSDVAYGGQGAPLVPIGDKLLFREYGFCLNIGGFSNISYTKNDKTIAFDIVPANIVLNYLAGFLDLPYDKDGNIAKSGTIDNELLQKLNNLSYYKAEPPKSLGREWVEENILPLINSSKISIADKISTYTEHIAIQISKILNKKNEKCLITGGGAFNKHLIEKIKQYSATEVILPDKNIVNYKEALIFALLGLLRWQKTPNCLPSVTGATKAAIGGAMYLP